jgi:hypothetical protein
MNRFLTGLLGLTLGFVTAAAEAQLVRVGPAGGVRVRAPFVSVDVLPFGLGTSVRAPFTSVNTRAYALGYRGYYQPGYRAPLYYAPVQPVYPVPVYDVYPAPVPVYNGAPAAVYSVPGQQFDVAYNPGAVGSPGNLVQQLRGAAVSLSQSLANRRDDGDIWLEYLAPGKIIAAIDANESLDSLGELLRNYEGVTGNPSLGSIQAASGFNQTYRLLQQLVNTRANTGTAASSTATQPGKSIVEPTPAPPVRAAVSDSTADHGSEEPVTAEELPIPVPLPEAE